MEHKQTVRVTIDCKKNEIKLDKYECSSYDQYVRQVLS